MTDFTDAIQMVTDMGPARAQKYLDANPDQAAEANNISQMTGADPSLVLDDLDTHKQALQSRMADEMIRKNPDLDAYIRAHPLAAAVSNDDLGNLDTLTRGMAEHSKLLKSLAHTMDVYNAGQGKPENPVAPSMDAMIRGFEEGYGPEPTGAIGLGMLASDEAIKANPALAATSMSVIGLVEGPFRTFLALPRAASEATKAGVEGTAVQAGMEPNAAEQLGNEAAGYTEYKFMGGEGHPLEGPGTRLAAELTTNPEFRKAFQEGQRIQKKIKPWTDAGLEPPRGVSKELDTYRANINADFVEKLQQDLDAAQVALTKERSPEIFKNVFERNYGKAEIGIDGRVVAELYPEGKLPTPDDGLLGFVPGIQDKLELARVTGADVQVPIQDWITNVDPAVAKQLGDDIRMWPQGVTAREATELPMQVERPPPIDGALPNIRDYLGTEPMNSIGDRRVVLERMVKEPVEDTGAESELGPAFSAKTKQFHDFVMKDSSGREIGTLNISVRPDGGLYVDWVGGINGVGPRDLGPGAVRDILKQLKAEFPEAETVGGHRVSGAREVAGSYHEPSAHIKLKLDEAGRRYIELPTIKLEESGEHPEGWATIWDLRATKEFQDLLNEGYHQPMPHGYWYNDRIGLTWPEPMKPLMQVVGKELERITGLKKKGLDWLPVQEIGRGDPGSGPVAWGQFWGFMDRLPLILVDLFGENPVGTARHEAIHFLRHANLITSSEWRVLQNAALEGKWLEKHNIPTRYAGLSLDKQIEEAVAEEFKDWGERADLKGKSRIALPFVQRIFLKMKDFWEGVKKGYREQTGKDPTAEDLFKDIHSGEMAKGQPTHLVRDPTTGGPMQWDDAAPIPMDQATGKLHDDALETQIEAMRASGAGLDVKSWNIIQTAIRERYEKDLAAAQARAEKEQAKRQTEEWKDNYKGVYKEVKANIQQRPDIAAHLFFGSGEMMGSKLAKKYRIATDSLTPEQLAMLPKHYVAKDGLPAEGLAHMFGFPDQDSMVASLRDSYAKQGDKTPQEYLAGLTKAAAQVEMERRYGYLEKNILEDATDQALSDADINILAEEMHAAGMLTGQTVIDKDVAAAQAWDMFQKLTIKEARGDTFLNAVARHARDTERALIAGDHAEALVGMQKKLISMMLAKHARRLEKEVGSFDKKAKWLSQREISSIDPEYLNYIHRVLMQVGKPVRRSIQDLLKETEARTPGIDFEQWVDHVNNHLGLEMPVWPELFDDAWKKEYPTLTTEEFRAVRDSIKTMEFNGRTMIKIEKSGETADRETLIKDLIGTLDRFPELGYNVEAGHQDDARTDTKIPKVVRAFVAEHIKMETFFNRLDKYDPDGSWNRFLMAQLFDGANQEDAWRKEFSHRLTALEDGEDLTKTVVNTLFRDPMADGTVTPNTPLSRMTRAGLRAVMLNMGTESNLTKLGKGFGVERAAIEAWVEAYATESDWKFVRGVWDIFKDIKERSDTMYRSMTGGVPSQDVPGRVVPTKYGDVEGGYYPLIAHPFLESKFPREDANALFDSNYVRASTPAGYMEKRSGATYPLSLSLDSMPGRIAQMIHDIALRPAVTEVGKIFYDTRIQHAIRTRYGEEYKDLLVPYLRDIANSRNYIPKNQAAMTRASEFLRQNMITALVGLNPGTFLKHTPTALIQSMHEVGYANFAKEFATMWAMNPEYGESNWAFALKRSLELQRRDRHWMETLGGAMNEFTGKSATLRNRVQYWSSKPVAMGDMISAVPTWLAVYKREIGVGRTEYDAIRLADRSVRRAHGSTSIADRPGVMRRGGMVSWMTTMYNFFNHIMNRQMEMVWKSGEIWDLAKQGEWKAAAKELQGRMGDLFAYVLAPALIEELVTPLSNAQTKQDEKHHSWARTAGMGLAYTLSASWVGVRDIANGMLHGSDPTVGLLGTAYKTGTDFYRDLGVKHKPFSKDHAGRLIRDAGALGGLIFGVPGQQIGRVGQFAHDVNVGKEHPKGPWGWLVGLRYGTTNKHAKTFQDWLVGKGH